MSAAPSNDATKKLLAQLWEKNLPVLSDRLTQLDAAAADAQLTTDAREQAANTAHKLAGSLGMFGYPNGTALARELELLFDSDTQHVAAATRLMKKLRAELGLH